MHSCDSQTSLRQNPARVPAFLLPGLPGIVVAFCLVLAGCNDTPHKAETDEPLPVAAVKPERRNVPLLVESTGMTQAVRTADIVARVEGFSQPRCSTRTAAALGWRTRAASSLRVCAWSWPVWLQPKGWVKV